LRKGELKYFW